MFVLQPNNVRHVRLLAEKELREKERTAVAVGLICVHEYTIAVAVACARNINTIVLPLQSVLERTRTQHENATRIN